MQTSSSHILDHLWGYLLLRRWTLRGTLLLVATLITAHLTRAQELMETAKCPPTARIDSAKDTFGTAVVADPYRWLEDQDSPETRAWIETEQKCTAAALSNLPGRAQIAKRLGELLHTDSFEAPVERGGRYFFRKRLADQDLMQLYIRRSLSAPDELLIDPLPWSVDHSASVTLENVSRDGKFAFYGRRDGGQDEITLRKSLCASWKWTPRRFSPTPFPRGNTSLSSPLQTTGPSIILL